jgi:hypothetical protein
MGPKTGRGAGFCAGYDVPGYANPAPGGFGRGRGQGRGLGRGGGVGFGMGFRGGRGGRWGVPAAYAAPNAAPTATQEVDVLKEQAEYLATALGDIQKRITELETDKAKN